MKSHPENWQFALWLWQHVHHGPALPPPIHQVLGIVNGTGVLQHQQHGKHLDRQGCLGSARRLMSNIRSVDPEAIRGVLAGGGKQDLQYFEAASHHASRQKEIRGSKTCLLIINVGGLLIYIYIYYINLYLYTISYNFFLMSFPVSPVFFLCWQFGFLPA